MSPEIRVTPKDASVVPQFVSILNSKGLEPFVGAGKNCISPNPPLPPPCFGKPPPPCVGRPPPPCYGGCYGGRGEIEQSPVKGKTSKVSG
ncbi:MAG: hypothetical protein Q7R31_02415 [Candidatus Levybacteria bacterium]|nr:hypothetical protein [Candidatus Levybacteria bacterium]